MAENIVKPKINTTTQKYVEPVETSKKVDDTENPFEPEKKNPNTNVKAMKGIKSFRDGKIREWNWDMLPMTEQPMWILGTKILGLNANEAAANQNEVADIMKLVLEYLQTEDPIEIGKFIRHELRHTPTSGNRLYNLLHNLVVLTKGEENDH